MLSQHAHPPGVFDAGHCWACARPAGLLDYCRQVQQQGTTLREAHEWTRTARRHAVWSLWSSGDGIPLGAVALLPE